MRVAKRKKSTASNAHTLSDNRYTVGAICEGIHRHNGANAYNTLELQVSLNNAVSTDKIFDYWTHWQTTLFANSGPREPFYQIMAVASLGGIIKELFHIFKIRHNLTSTNRPETNGQIERSHACIKDFLRCYSERFADWDKLIPLPPSDTTHRSIQSLNSHHLYLFMGELYDFR